MKIYLYLALLATLECSQVFAEDCEPNTVVLGNTWNQGQGGKLIINVPDNTFKWKVEITYDEVPNSISAWQGKRAKCRRKTKTCSFSSRRYNKKQDAGNLLELGYQIQFDEDAAVPKVNSVKFKYCDAEPCPKGYKDSAIKEYVVCPVDDATATDTPTSEAPTNGTTDSPVTEGTTSSTEAGSGNCVQATHTVDPAWSVGQNGKFAITVPEDVDSWEVQLIFDKSVNGIDAYQGVAESCDGAICTFSNENWNGIQQAGNKLELTYQIQFDTDSYPQLTSAAFNSVPFCEGDGSTDNPTTTPTDEPTTNGSTEATTEAQTTEGSTEIPTDRPTTETPTEGTTEVQTTEGATETSTDMPTTEVPTEGPTVTPTDNCHTVESAWNVGHNGKLTVNIPVDMTTWEVQLMFDKPVNSIEAYQGVAENCGGSICTFSNENWNGVQQAGHLLELTYQIQYDTNTYPQLTSAAINGIPFCGGDDISTDNPTAGPTDEPTTQGPTDVPTNQPTTEGSTNGPTNGPTTEGPTGPTTEGPIDNGQCNTELTNYKEVIKLSILFYEAQRSGKLPANNRITWRRDSALNDGDDVGVDLTGGYYDAGDYVKFGFPAAAAMTVLAWGGISYKDGYQAAGEYDNLLDAIKWGTDYFIKCHVSDNEFYGQVGDGDTDHAWWGRPEDMDMQRPSMKIDAQHPGSDLAGETAASLASASILFQGKDDAYSSELLDHAKKLFNFADTYRGKYSDSIQDAAGFYNSWNGYNDELVWAAAWLYKATGESSYLDKAEQYYNDFNLANNNWFFSWDNKLIGVHTLMAELTGEPIYKSSLKSFCDHTVSGQTRSPNGMLFYYQWGSLRYASNAAFVCLKAADLIDGKSDVYTELAQGQMDYILGENGQSFVAGYGPNYPKNPHHASSHCPDPPAACGWGEFGNSDENTHVLYGALVGGPGAADDQYNDKRNDYIENEVTLDYNAGFQSVLAGLQMKKCTTTST